jgi:hypothetical protein
MTGDHPVYITQGYTRQRHWELIYHDLYDLYGPLIGERGAGLYGGYKRFRNNTAGHLLEKKAWPSHRDLLTSLFGTSQDKLRYSRKKLVAAGLIDAEFGRDLVARSRREYDAQLAVQWNEGKPRKAVELITLADLAALGIQNPANTLFVTINDPLPLFPFCERFALRFESRVKKFASGGFKWEMKFVDYAGILVGPNRLQAAARYIEDNLLADPGDRGLRPLVSVDEILALMRCSDEDKETIAVRNRLLEMRASIAGEEVYRPDGQSAYLPPDVVAKLERLGWKGPTDEVKRCFEKDPEKVRDLLWDCVQLIGSETVRNPAGLFRDSLRVMTGEPDTGLKEIEF